MTIQDLSYFVDGDAFAGRLFRPSTDVLRPCVLVCHEGSGPGEHAWERALRLANLGYVAYVPDFLGGPFPNREAHVGAIRALVGDPERLRRRAVAALDALCVQPGADRTRAAAIGFCFGGTVALELARSGADVACVVSFHGGLSSPLPAEPGSVRSAVLVCTGSADPFIGMNERRAFEEEMTRAAADWQMIVYSGALHAFTNPNIDPELHRGSAYHARADRRSWVAMRQAFEEVFGDA